MQPATDIAALTDKGRAVVYAGLDRAQAKAGPRQRLTVSEWADLHRWLTSKQTGEPGQWRTSRNPMLREIQDAFSLNNAIREIWVMKSSQVGVSEACVNVLGYYMDHEPCPLIYLMPTLEESQKWKAQKLNPMLQEPGRIRDIMGGLRSRDAANNQTMIDFPGGILFMGGGNSPNSYAQKTARVALIDDFDRFPGEVGDEGDPEGLVRGRVKTYPTTHKLGFISTPTIKGASLIERGFDRTDRRRYHVACPHCGHRQHLRWGNLKWDQASAIPAWAEYECEQCGHGIRENHKPTLLREGIWIPERPEIITRRGYQVTALTAPIGLGPSWLSLAQDFLIAKQDPGTLKVFVNQNLGETWEDNTNKVTSHELAKRMGTDDMRVIPPGCLAITVGIDTQDDWLAVTLLGWGAPLRPDGPPRLWILDWYDIRVSNRNTTHPELWDELETYLHLPLINHYGRPMKISAGLIDSRGHRSKEVRDFVQRPSLRVVLYSGQGATNRMNRPIAQTASDVDKNRKGKALRSGYGVWNVGTEHVKSYLYGRLAADGDLPPAERIIHFPAGLPTDYFDGLLSEVYDPEKRRFVQKPGAKYKRNEPIDTLTYAWAVAHHKNVMIGLRHTRAGYVNDMSWWKRRAETLESPPVGRVAVPAVPGAMPLGQPAPEGRLSLAQWGRKT